MNYTSLKRSWAYVHCMINVLVELNHKNNTEKNQELYVTGKSSNVIKLE